MQNDSLLWFLTVVFFLSLPCSLHLSVCWLLFSFRSLDLIHIPHPNFLDPDMLFCFALWLCAYNLLRRERRRRGIFRRGPGHCNGGCKAGRPGPAHRGPWAETSPAEEVRGVSEQPQAGILEEEEERQASQGSQAEASKLVGAAL